MLTGYAGGSRALQVQLLGLTMQCHGAASHEA